MSTEQYDFSAWDKQEDLAALSRAVLKAQANSGGFEKIPYGTYIVAVDNIALTLSKQGQKQVVVDFMILEHETLKGKILKAFFGLEHVDLQKRAFKIHKANEFLRSLKPNVEVPSFTSYSQLNATVNAVMADIAANKWEYEVRYEQENGHDRFTIENKYATEDADCPF